jgi:hypothetical protein
MDKATLMQQLSKQPTSIRLQLLSAAYDAMNDRQRQAVFGAYIRPQPEAPKAIIGQDLLQEIEQLRQDSLNRKYYAPFNMNSRNYRQIPEKTSAWFSQLGQFLTSSIALTDQGDHASAAACFGLLFELILAMENGKEIVFAEEVGSWMIRVDEKKVMAAYLKSLAAVASPEQYAAMVVPLIKRDSRQGFSGKVYLVALRAASKAQKASLLDEIERQQIETDPAQPPRRSGKVAPSDRLRGNDRETKP